MRVLAVEVEHRLDRSPLEVVPAQFGHPGLVFATADGREGDATDGARAEDVAPDENRPAVASPCDKLSPVARRRSEFRRRFDRLEHRLVGEAFEPEAEAVAFRARNGVDCCCEGLRVKKVVLIREHHIGRFDQLERGVARRSAAAVLLVDDSDPGIARGSLREDFARAVGGAVVYANAVPVAKALILNGVEESGEIPLSVIDGNDEGDGCHGVYSAGLAICGLKLLLLPVPFCLIRSNELKRSLMMTMAVIHQSMDERAWKLWVVRKSVTDSGR